MKGKKIILGEFLQSSKEKKLLNKIQARRKRKREKKVTLLQQSDSLITEEVGGGGHDTYLIALCGFRSRQCATVLLRTPCAAFFLNVYCWA